MLCCNFSASVVLLIRCFYHRPIPAKMTASNKSSLYPFDGNTCSCLSIWTSFSGACVCGGGGDGKTDDRLSGYLKVKGRPLSPRAVISCKINCSKAGKTLGARINFIDHSVKKITFRDQSANFKKLTFKFRHFPE